MSSPRPPKVSVVDGWTSVALGDGIEANEPSGKIQRAFEAATLAGKSTPAMAVFTFYDLGANVVTAYFSPAAASIGAAFGAAPCAKPVDREGFSLLVGDARSRALLFGQ